MSMETSTEPAVKTVTPLHFARFEFKYILNGKMRKAVEEELLFFLDYDPFVVDQPDHKYFVRSLYYDNPQHTAFHDKIDGLHTRAKFRIRTYTRDPDDTTPWFLEIKGRHDNLVFKRRVPVDRSGLNLSVLNGDSMTQALLDRVERCDLRDKFEFEILRKKISPIALIDYERRPYFSKYDPNFRITFDEGLIATETKSLFPIHHGSPKRILAGYTILEIKFRHHLPSWFHRVIQSYELRRVPISKICAGMETLGLDIDEN